MNEKTITYWESMSRSDKHACYSALLLMIGLIASDIYFRPKVNAINHASMDPAIRKYDFNRNGKIEEKELESIVKDLQNFYRKR